jgi:hypothetical protein
LLFYETAENPFISGKLFNYEPFEALELLFVYVGYMFRNMVMLNAIYYPEVRKMDKCRILKLVSY